MNNPKAESFMFFLVALILSAPPFCVPLNRLLLLDIVGCYSIPELAVLGLAFLIPGLLLAVTIERFTLLFVGFAILASPYFGAIPIIIFGVLSGQKADGSMLASVLLGFAMLVLFGAVISRRVTHRPGPSEPQNRS